MEMVMDKIFRADRGEVISQVQCSRCRIAFSHSEVTQLISLGKWDWEKCPHCNAGFETISREPLPSEI
jgi:predicted  nucleic acid-binding Zn-ribbon protein